MKIGIIGTGSWASALAQVLTDNNHEVILKGVNQSEIDDINLNHQNSAFFPQVNLHPKIKATNTYTDIVDSDVLLLAVPVVACESVALEIRPLLKKKPIVINVAKGFHPQSKKRLSLCLTEAFGTSIRGFVSLLGPSHAEEVVLRLLTSVNVVSLDENLAKEIQTIFANNYFRVYWHNDVIGAEIAAATKNIMAIASGVLTGLKQGDNARAALMTRGLAELTRFGLALGAKKETFLGLNGVGDLIVTCSSYHSRNFQAGLKIGQANSARDFLLSNKITTEGILTTKTVHELAKELAISMPITEAVYAVLYKEHKPSEVIETLMNRPLKEERI